MRRRFPKCLALLSALLLLLVTASPANAFTGDPAKADASVAWLRSQLSGNLIQQYGTADYGLTLDTVLGMRAAGRSPSEVKPILDAMGGLADRLEYQGSITTGMVGKALVAAHVSDYPVTNFHGKDLVALAQRSVDAAGKVDGGAGDTGKNIFSQTFVMIGLAQQGKLPAATVSFLADQQCSAGYFRMYYTDGQTCDAAGSGYDVDGTALALFALEAADEAGIAAAAAPLERGRKWLASVQEASGGFPGSRFTPTANSNSTGLAAAALRDAAPAAAQRAADFVAGLVYPSGSDAGAIAFLPEQRKAWTGGSLSSAQRSGAIRATPQALLAFAPANYAFLDRAPGITASSAGAKLVGDTTYTWGKVATNAPVPVWTEVHIAGSGWSRSQQSTTSASGSYSIPLTYGASTPGTYRWRVGVRHASGQVEYSAEFTLRRVARTTAASAGYKQTGKTTYTWGRVSTSTPVKVWSEVYIAGSGWSRSQVSTTSSSGYYSIPLTYGSTTPGTYRWRVGVEHSFGQSERTREFTLQRVARPTAASAGSARVGSTAYVWGTVAGGPSLRVWSEVNVGGGWGKSQERVTSSTGYYAIPLTYGATTPGTYRWRVAAALPNGEVLRSDELTFVRTR